MDPFNGKTSKKIYSENDSRLQGFGADNFLIIRHILQHGLSITSRQIPLPMLEPRFREHRSLGQIRPGA